jgi:hypothetical protein
VILLALMALSLSGAPQQAATTRPAPLQLHDLSQKILQHEKALLGAAGTEQRGDGVEFEIAMQLSRIASEAADDVSVMSDLTSIEHRLSCEADRTAIGPTVQTRLSYTVRRLDLLVRSAKSHQSFTKDAAIGKSAAGLVDALQETRAVLAGLLSAR